MVLKDAREIPSSLPKYYRTLNMEILGGIIQALGPPNIKVLDWSYHIYFIETREPVYSSILRDELI